jgi:hypothetical protein
VREFIKVRARASDARASFRVSRVSRGGVE